MIDPEPSAETEQSPMRGQLWHPGRPGELPPDFLPLRLVLHGTEHSIELTQADQVLGRHSEAEIRLPLPDVSRRHCRLAFQDGRWHVWDLNSLNGTFLNDSRVKHAELENGDVLRIGGFAFDVSFQESHPTVELPVRAPAAGDILGRIAGALPPEGGRTYRRAS